MYQHGFGSKNCDVSSEATSLVNAQMSLSSLVWQFQHMRLLIWDLHHLNFQSKVERSVLPQCHRQHANVDGLRMSISILLMSNQRVVLIVRFCPLCLMSRCPTVAKTSTLEFQLHRRRHLSLPQGKLLARHPQQVPLKIDPSDQKQSGVKRLCCSSSPYTYLHYAALGKHSYSFQHNYLRTMTRDQGRIRPTKEECFSCYVTYHGMKVAAHLQQTLQGLHHLLLMERVECGVIGGFTTF